MFENKSNHKMQSSEFKHKIDWNLKVVLKISISKYLLYFAK